MQRPKPQSEATAVEAVLLDGGAPGAGGEVAGCGPEGPKIKNKLCCWDREGPGTPKPQSLNRNFAGACISNSCIFGSMQLKSLTHVDKRL